MPDNTQVEHFLSALQSEKGFAGNTLSAYRNDLSQFSTFLEQGAPGLAPTRDWTSVGREHIMAFILQLRERSYSQTTVARKLAAIKSFFRYLVASELVPANPAENMASPHVDRGLPQTVSSSEVERLLSVVASSGDTPESGRDRAMFQLLYATGLRAGEMVALDVNDVDLPGASIMVAAGRGKQRRIAVASRGALQAIADYLDRDRPALVRNAEAQGANLAGTRVSGDALFLNHRGQRLTRQGFWLILKAYARTAGLGEITPHMLRHSFAAQTLMSGADIRDLQQILGHANVSTTQIYNRIGGGGAKRAGKRDSPRGTRKAG